MAVTTNDHLEIEVFLQDKLPVYVSVSHGDC